MKLTYIHNTNKYKTIRQVLKNRFHISNSLTTTLKKNEAIRLNGTFTYLDKELMPNDVIDIDFDYAEQNDIVPVEQKLNILYEDEWFLILSKPAGIPVHPSMSHFKDSLSNGVSFYFNQIGLNKKIRIINRLDKGTSGIVMFAKCEYIQEALKKQKDSKAFKKKYLAVLEGHLDQSTGTISAPISRKEKSIIERKIDFEHGATAITHFKVINNFCYNDQELSLVEYTLETGRTHQLRLHSAHINHPILGDTLYGNESKLISHQALHAYQVCFIHPITSKEVVITDNNFYDFKKIIENQIS